MTSSRQGRRTSRVVVAVGVVAFAVAMLTLLLPEWLEVTFGLDPDEGTGSAEQAVTAGAGLLFAACAVVTGRRLVPRSRQARLGRREVTR